MKRIRYAFPIESMSGVLGSKQDLRYAENDNKAFESPQDKVNYARNYQPRCVAARVTKSGLNYFAVKTKSAFKNTAALRKQNALMGATSAIYGISIKDVSKLTTLQQMFAALQTQGYKGTFHKFVSDFIRADLAANVPQISATVGAMTVNLGNNPYTTEGTAIEIKQDMLVKFWNELAKNGVTFKVEGETGIAISEMGIEEVIAIPRLNVLGLSVATVSEDEYLKKGDKWLTNSEGEYINSAIVPEQGEEFFLTDVAPTA